MAHERALRLVIALTIAGRDIEQIEVGSITLFRWTAGLAVDADGSPRAYHPLDIGLDALANAKGKNGTWPGLVVAGGVPVIQGPDDPAPGYYVSKTALGDPGRNPADPRRYVDASTIPYLVLPPELVHAGLQLGDVALATRTYRETKDGPEITKECPAIFADIGPHKKIGEGSCALARALGINESPRHGGVDDGVKVYAWLKSATQRPWPRAYEGISTEVMKLKGLLPS